MADNDIHPQMDDDEIPDMPEDVAVLYSWANMQGAKYRDFSASRREYRAQLRQKALEAQREAELRAAREREEVAQREETAARRVAMESAPSRAAAEEAALAAERARRSREEAERHAQVAALAEKAALDAEREVEEARRHAAAVAARYAESDARRKAFAGPQPGNLPGEVDDPYRYASHSGASVVSGTSGVRERSSSAHRAESRGTSTSRHLIPSQPPRPVAQPSTENWIPAHHESEAERVSETEQRLIGKDEVAGLRREEKKLEEYLQGNDPERPRMVVSNPEHGYRPEPIETETEPRPKFEEESKKRAREQAEEYARIHEQVSESHAEHVRQPAKNDFAIAAEQAAAALRQAEIDRVKAEQNLRDIRREASLREQYGVSESGFHAVPEGFRSRAGRSSASHPAVRMAEPVTTDSGASRPAWLYSEQPSSSRDAALSDTLQHSRERVAARWFALKELMGQAGQEVGQSQPAPPVTPGQGQMQIPVVAVISVTGGTGKTSIVATLGRTLSAMGEKVLLADMSTPGLLPYYFGSRDLKPGVVRTFSPPAGSPDAPVYMVNYETDPAGLSHDAQEQIYKNLLEASRGIHRVLLDLHIDSAWLVRRVARMSTVILVPVAPDMNSMLGIQALERMLGSLKDADGRPVQPFYVLNQFDASLPLHLDMREAMRQMLGNRLLPIVIRRTSAVAEALAEGMTVMDYAPNSPVAEDFTQLANWTRSLTAPAATAFRGMRWSEG